MTLYLVLNQEGMNSNKRGEHRLRYGVPSENIKPRVKGKLDDSQKVYPNSVEPAELSDLNGGSPNEESKHSEDSDFEDPNDGGKIDDAEFNKIMNDLT